MAVTMTALQRGHLAAGDAVLVVGPGPVGLLGALAARAAAAAVVVVAGRAEGPRLATARRLGFPTTVAEDAGDALRERTGGRGADLVLEATGTAAGVDAAFASVRRRGRIAAVGLSGSPSIDVRWDFATTRDVDLAFAMSSQYEAWEPALSILERVAADAATFPEVFPLAEWQRAFEAAERRTVVKAVIDPSATDGGRT
jgi:threonine dehydrogenase-like Zn-dependent dehydrogenase